jgi:tetratricopeptide (TPR) repeat protein
MKFLPNYHIKAFFYIISFYCLSNPTYAEELLEYSIFEKVYLSQKQQSEIDQRETSHKLDRFNHKGHEVKSSGEPLEIPAYNFDISISGRSDVETKRYFLNDRGYQSLISGDYESAIFYYEEFINKYGNDLDVLTAIGSAYQRLGDLETSKKYYGDVLLEDPSHEVALNNYIVLIGEDKPDVGISALKKINLLHNSKIISAQLGYLYALKQDYVKAKDAFEEAFRADNNDIKLSYNLALSYDYLGNNRSAYLLYKQILYNMRYREHQNMIPRDSLKERYKVLEQLMQEGEGRRNNG